MLMPAVIKNSYVYSVVGKRPLQWTAETAKGYRPRVACSSVNHSCDHCQILPRPALPRPALPCLVLERYSATHVSGRCMFCSSIVWKRVSHVTHVTFAGTAIVCGATQRNRPHEAACPMFCQESKLH